jgi:hypothetical protein
MDEIGMSEHLSRLAALPRSRHHPGRTRKIRGLWYLKRRSLPRSRHHLERTYQR